MLERMRLDGLDRAWVPFAERHFLAWRGTPVPGMDTATLINGIKVLTRTLPTSMSESACNQTVMRWHRHRRQVQTLQNALLMSGFCDFVSVQGDVHNSVPQVNSPRLSCLPRNTFRQVLPQPAISSHTN